MILLVHSMLIYKMCGVFAPFKNQNQDIKACEFSKGLKRRMGPTIALHIVWCDSSIWLASSSLSGCQASVEDVPVNQVPLHTDMLLPATVGNLSTNWWQ